MLSEISHRLIGYHISVKYKGKKFQSTGGDLMDKRNNDFDFDFRPLGLAIKKAREAQGVTREQLANIIDYNPRHLQAVENEGQYPSIELFLQLITMFDVSVDEHIHMEKKPQKSSVRRRLDAMLDQLDDKELSIVEATVNGLCKATEQPED